ncbi:MAG: hypothetical protein H7318_15715 [Oligoflexus sp.]|nr:hypothetical protein [Oligoflexus sp.]
MIKSRNVFVGFLMLFLGLSQQIFAEIRIDLPQSEEQLNKLLDTLRTTALPQVETIERCMRETNNVVTDYTEIRRRYLSHAPNTKPLASASDVQVVGSNYDLSLTLNFDYYTSTNATFFQIIDTFITEEARLDNDATLEDINGHYRSLDRRLNALREQLYPTTQIETQFLSFLDGSRKGLSRYLTRNKTAISRLASDECENAPVKEKLLLLQADASELMNVVSEMRDFALALRLKRTNLVQRLQIIASQRVDSLWRNRFAIEATETQDKIEKLLKTARIGAELEESWILSNMRGLGDGLHLKFLQYQAPLRILITELGRLKEFERRFQALASSEPGDEQIYLGKIQNYREVVNKEIAALIAKGWKGQLGRQILLNKKRLEKATGICKERLENHLRVASIVTNESGFAEAEQNYFEVINSCTAK